MHSTNPQANHPSASKLSNSENIESSAGAPRPLIDVKDVSVTANGTVLLAPISLQADPGQIVALRGENGSGKTTLLRCLAGCTTPTAGTVKIAGQSVNERDREFRSRVAAMIGLPPIASDLTVFDHVALVASTW